LHRFRIQTLGVGKNGKLVAGKDVSGEYIQVQVSITSRIGHDESLQER
jgi:hypothetical protein